VVVVAALGTWVGATIAFFIARTVGRALILRYGRYVFVPEKKWLLAEAWILHYSAAGVFFAQLMPIVRHVISLPAGAARMNYRTFSLSFLAGALVECSVLAWFGAHVLGSRTNLLDEPDLLRKLVVTKLWWLIAAAVVLALLYVAMDTLGRRAKAATKRAEP
jgi:membrane protein DedA with SNARE-associated domain